MFSWPIEDEVNVQLLSDTIVFDAETAGYRTGLNAAFWRAFCQAELIGAHSASLFVQGWSGAWGTPRQPAVAIAAGSTFRLAIGSDTDATKLGRLSTEGLGLRTHEGFGWVAVNPPWLRAGRGVRYKGEKASHSILSGPPLSWPGVPLGRGVQLKIAKLARTLETQVDKHGPKVVELALRVSRANTAQALTYLDAMANRPNSAGWDTFADVLLNAGFRELPKEEMSFLLDALAGLIRDRKKL